MVRIGIREEDSYTWERRVPLIPADVASLRSHGIDVVVERSAKRAYTDQEYTDAAVPVVEDLSDCPIIVGLKEVPAERVAADTLYVFFSHTIKGQPCNMPMLARLMEQRCTLVDYERIVDADGRRLIFFGNYAGLAGMIDSLWALGQRLAVEAIDSPFLAVERALHYPDLDAAKDAIRAVGDAIRRDGLPSAIAPLVVGVAGYGNVSHGVQEILQLLPVRALDPSDLLHGRAASLLDRHTVGMVVFREEHTVAPRAAGAPFDLERFFREPTAYRSAFDRYLPHLDVLMNCVYWSPGAPRLVTKAWARDVGAARRLRVIGDISCDVEGAVELTVKATEPDNPVYVYDAVRDRAIDGVDGDGPVVLAVEILPSELPREASAYFSEILKRYIPSIAGASLDEPLETSGLPEELVRATIVHRGRLTPAYRHLEAYLPGE